MYIITSELIYITFYIFSQFIKMPPNATTTNECTGVLNEADAETIDGGLVKDITVLKKAEKRKLVLVWRNIILFAYLHLAAVYGLYLMVFSAKWSTGIFG